MQRLHLCLLGLAGSIFFSNCSGKYGAVDFEESPKIINVSAYDPKEKQRPGSSYSPLNQTALRANGALGMIARCGKGLVLDTKCADFLVGADRQGMKLGAYYYVKPNVNIEAQARQFVTRLRTIKKTKGIRGSRVLLVGDIDSKCTASHIIRFINEMERLTGVTPVIYMENSKAMIARMKATPKSQKRQIARAPYWLALYSPYNEAQPHIKTPKDLLKAYGVWSDWAMWQYGGVFWENGRSAPKNYVGGSWRTPPIFRQSGSPDRAEWLQRQPPGAGAILVTAFVGVVNKVSGI